MADYGLQQANVEFASLLLVPTPLFGPLEPKILLGGTVGGIRFYAAAAVQLVDFGWTNVAGPYIAPPGSNYPHGYPVAPDLH